MLKFHGVLALLLALIASSSTQAIEATTLARELVQVKGGYIAKKRLLEEMRLRAYVPLMLKAVGKGPQWNPTHPRWRAVEKRITEDWFGLNAAYLRSLGRDLSYVWIDDALAREYVRTLSVDELLELIAFYRAPAGIHLLKLELDLLAIYPASMVRALTLAMIATETLSGREQELFKSPESRLRRDFVSLFEIEAIIRQESVRTGGAYVEASYPTVQQGALAIAADRIDALRARMPLEVHSAVTTFLSGRAARKERALLASVLPVALAAPEDPVLAVQQETEFFKNLAAKTAEWRRMAEFNAADQP
jgi:hypothetical protein